MGSIDLIKFYRRRVILQYLLPECRGTEKKTENRYEPGMPQITKDEIFNSVSGKTIASLKILNLLLRKNFYEMFKKLKDLYNAYKPYVRVDLIMYAVLIMSIIVYFIISAIIG